MPEPQVPEDALDQQLDALRERAARLVPVERPAATGDFLVIDFDGSSGGKRLRNASARDYLVELGGGRLVGEFDSRLAGMSAGESVEFPVTYADSDGREELRGRTVNYTVTVKQVQQKELPPLDDDLAVGVSEFDTLDELRADVQRRLDEAAEAEVDELFRRMVIDAAVANATVNVPAVMVNRRIGTILQQTASQLPEGVSFEQYLAAERPHARAGGRGAAPGRRERGPARAGGGGRRRRRGHRGLRRGDRGAGARGRRGDRARARPARCTTSSTTAAGRRCARTCASRRPSRCSPRGRRRSRWSRPRPASASGRPDQAREEQAATAGKPAPAGKLWTPGDPR